MAEGDPIDLLIYWAKIALRLASKTKAGRVDKTLPTVKAEDNP